MKKRELAERKARVEAFLHKELGCGDASTVEIITWPRVAKYGVRVAEISVVAKDRQSGVSFMQSDPPAADVLFYTERLLIEDDEDEIDLQEELLRMAIRSGEEEKR